MSYDAIRQEIIAYGRSRLEEEYLGKTIRASELGGRILKGEVTAVRFNISERAISTGCCGCYEEYVEEVTVTFTYICKTPKRGLIREYTHETTLGNLPKIVATKRA